MNDLNQNYQEELHPHGYLLRAASLIKKHLWRQEPDVGWGFVTLPIILCHVASFEALCNYIGFNTIDFWDKIERSTKIKDKIDILSKAPIDYGTNPWQDVQNCIKIRNDIVHGKVEIRTVSATIEFSNNETTVKDMTCDKFKFHKAIDFDLIDRISDSFREAAFQLLRANDMSEDEYFSQGCISQ